MNLEWSKKVFFTSILCITGTCILIYSIFKKRRVIPEFQNTGASTWVCSNLEDWQSIQKEFLTSCEKTKVIGLDCEWTMVNNKPLPVGLLQLATVEGVCILLRLNKFCHNFPPELCRILEDNSILKLGVGIQNDALKLLRDHGIIVKGSLDLRHLVDHLKVRNKLAIQKMGLQELAKVIVGVTLNKSFRIRCSNWDSEELNSEQIKYAAADAIVANKIFISLMNTHVNRYFFWRTLSVTDLYKMALLMFSNLLDVPYRQKAVSPGKNLLTNSKSMSTNEKTKSYSVRKTPLYRNCHLQAPDGELLCTCDVKKVQWYLDKHLGEIVQENPFTVRLLFEPSGRPTMDNRYYTLDKLNICVVCGSTKSLIRKVVVPHEYRKHFPKLMKNSLSHDVLLLCVLCHQRSNAYDSLMRQQLAQKYNAPIGAEEEMKVKEEPLLKKVKSAGRALLLNREVIPESRVKVLEEIIKEYYEIKTFDDEVLSMAANMETCIPNDGFTPHGLKVVQEVSTDCGLVAFEAFWRQHFLDTMKPRYLPEMWSVDHNHERLAQQISELDDPGFDINILGLHKTLF